MDNDIILLDKEINKTMYHGTIDKHYYSLKSGVDFDECLGNKDFGKGFYLTTNFEQASIHASKRANTFFNRGKYSPVVFVYEVDVSSMYTYNHLLMNRLDDEWAEFIYNNRNKAYKYDHDYDWVFGGVADGQIVDEVKLMHTKKSSISEFRKAIANYPEYDQLSVHNPEIFHYNIIRNIGVVNPFEQSSEYNFEETIHERTRDLRVSKLQETDY